MNYIRKADLYKLIAKLKQNWGLDKNEVLSELWVL